MIIRSEAVDIGGRLIRQWTGLVIKHAWLTVAATLLFAVFCATYAVGNLGVSTKTEDLISSDQQWLQDFDDFREQFPQIHRVLVLVVDAQTEALAQSAVTDLDSRLANSSDLLLSQYSATVDEPLAGRELLLLGEEELFDLADDIAAAQPLIGRLRQNYSITEFLNILTAAFERDSIAIAPAFVSQLSTTLQTTKTDNSKLFDWSSQNRDEDKPARRLVLVKPVLDSEKARPAKRALKALRNIGEETSTAYAGRVDVRLTGSLALEDQELVSASKSAGSTGILALVSVLLILLIALRSWRLLLVSLVTLVTGLTATAAFAAAAFTKLNVISIAFAVLYIGLGIDLVIHYLLRLRERLATDSDLQTALLDTSQQIGGALFICALTTAAGFYAFVPTDFVGVSQLGLISGTGMFISLIVSMTLLPALVWLVFPKGIQISSTASHWQAGVIFSWLVKAPRVVIAVVLLAVCAAAFTLPDLRFENDPLQLRDPASESVQTFKELNRDPNTAVRSLSVLADADADVTTLIAKLNALPSVSRVLSLSSFKPDDVDNKLLLVEEIALLLGDDFADFPALASLNVAAVTAALQKLQASSNDSNENLSNSLSSVLAHLDQLDDTAKQDYLERLQFALLGDLPAAMQLLSSRLGPEPLDSMPQDFRKRWISDAGQQLLQVIPANDLSVPENIRQFVDEVVGVAPQATGVPVMFERSGDTVISAFKVAFITAFLVIGVFLFFLLQQKKNVLIALIPLVASAVLLAGTMLLFDIPLNYANIIALPLLLGISVDTGIHLIHRSEHPLHGHRDLLTSSTARAILFSSITTVASFGNLALSAHLGMASMGQMLTVGLIINVIIMLTLLPAMLSLRSQ